MAWSTWNSYVAVDDGVDGVVVGRKLLVLGLSLLMLGFAPLGQFGIAGICVCFRRLQCHSYGYVFDCRCSFWKRQGVIGWGFLAVYSFVAIVFLDGPLFPFLLLFLLLNWCLCFRSPYQYGCESNMGCFRLARTNRAGYVAIPTNSKVCSWKSNFVSDNFSRRRRCFPSRLKPL